MRKNLTVAYLIIVLSQLYGLSYASQATQDLKKANELFAQKRYTEALSLYKSILSSSPPDVSFSALSTRIGDSYFQLGNYQGALDAYRNALKNQKPSERPPTQYWIGFCYLMLGRDAEAVNELLKVPELYPGSGMWASTAYYWAARASERMGRKEQAAEFYRKAGGNGKSSQGRFALKKAESVNKAANSK